VERDSCRKGLAALQLGINRVPPETPALSPGKRGHSEYSEFILRILRMACFRPTKLKPPRQRRQRPGMLPMPFARAVKTSRWAGWPSNSLGGEQPGRGEGVIDPSGCPAGPGCRVERGDEAAVELEAMLLTRQPEELFAAADDADWLGWVDFFSRTREPDGRRKGLVEIQL
jgi:hypothetical protein